MKNQYSKMMGALTAASVVMTGYAVAGVTEPAPMVAPAPARDFFEGEIHVGYNNMYEHRFVDLGDDMVEAGVDVAFDLGGGWSINAGAWYASTNDDKYDYDEGPSYVFGDDVLTPYQETWRDSFNELDLYAGVGAEYGMFNFEVGYIYYFFPDNRDVNTSEIYASVGVDLPWEMGLTATGYYDIEEYSGLYVDLKVTKSFELTECLGLDLAAGIGYADGHGLQQDGPFNWRSTRDGYQGWYISAALPWEIVENVTLTPYIKYTDADSDLVTDNAWREFGYIDGAGGYHYTGYQNGTSQGKDYIVAGATLSVAF